MQEQKEQVARAARKLLKAQSTVQSSGDLASTRFRKTRAVVEP